MTSYELENGGFAFINYDLRVTNDELEYGGFAFNNYELRVTNDELGEFGGFASINY